MEQRSGKFYLQKRYLVAFLSFLGLSFLLLMRANLSISIVDMTSNRSLIVGNETVIQVAEFDWSSKEKGVILSAFSWGYVVAPLGAYVSRKCGGVTTFGAGLAVTGLLTILTPVLIRCHLYVYLAARILEGVAEVRLKLQYVWNDTQVEFPQFKEKLESNCHVGIASTAFNETLRVWSTPKDRSRLIGFSASGFILGAMLGYPVCGTIAYYLDWKSVFYITGGASLILSLFWFTLLRNSPEEDNMMTVQEKRYFEQSNSYSPGKKIAFPWKRILTSKAVWAYWNERFSTAWSEFFLSYSLPLYIKDIHDVNIQDVGLISSIPQFCAVVGVISAGFLADFLRNRGILSPSNVHKSYFGFSQFIALVLFIIVALSENFLTSIVCFCLFRLFFNISVVSYQVLPVDIAGHFSCIILGLGQTATALGYTLSPLLMGMTVTYHTSAEWSTYFLIMSCMNVWGGIIFFKFGSGELQSWAVPTSNIENAEH